MSETVDVLSKVPLFLGLAPEQLQMIDAATRSKHCLEGETIIREGEHGNVMYVLTKGKVEVSRTVTLGLARGGVGEGEKSFARLDAEDHPAFGEMALLEDSLRGATVTALTECELLEITHDDFDRLCHQDPVLGYRVIRNMASQLSARLRRTNQDVLKLSTALSLALGRR